MSMEVYVLQKRTASNSSSTSAKFDTFLRGIQGEFGATEIHVLYVQEYEAANMPLPLCPCDTVLCSKGIDHPLCLSDELRHARATKPPAPEAGRAVLMSGGCVVGLALGGMWAQRRGLAFLMAQHQEGRPMKSR